MTCSYHLTSAGARPDEVALLGAALLSGLPCPSLVAQVVRQRELVDHVAAEGLHARRAERAVHVAVALVLGWKEQGESSPDVQSRGTAL